MRVRKGLFVLVMVNFDNVCLWCIVVTVSNTNTKQKEER